jgi:hypothetical protein
MVLVCRVDQFISEGKEQEAERTDRQWIRRDKLKPLRKIRKQLANKRKSAENI